MALALEAPRKLLLVDRRKAALLGVPQAAIVATAKALAAQGQIDIAQGKNDEMVY